MDREILFRFMQCETTPQEELAVLNWLDEDQANQHEMDRLDEIFNAMVLHAPAPAPRSCHCTGEAGGRKRGRSRSHYSRAGNMADIFLGRRICHQWRRHKCLC